ncbi:MAG: 4a-hydroxytetrahydrobiopterin dehydratase [Thaumarchaeota archaeon]|nr:4a-hydroxytetrahydrobiopterin dehydratase [Nitrososphaerota archaeon]
MPRLLDESEIKKLLKTLKGWKHDGKFITKSFEFESFMEGIAFVSRVAEVAEMEEHHPDIHIRYTTVTLSVQTHSEGGVTEWDLELAEAIEKMVEATKATPHARR